MTEAEERDLGEGGPGPTDRGATGEADRDRSGEARRDLQDLSEPGAEPTEESTELEDLRRELEYVNDRHLRLAAEFDNYRRRVQAQLGKSQARAQAELVGKILEVVDDLRRVTDVDPEMASVESVLEGVRLLERKLLQSLSDAGLDELDPSGEPFDPNTMEAMTRAPAASEAEDDTVAEVFQRGFRFRGHLIRPARVSVRKLE